jgi:uncharacterized protein
MKYLLNIADWGKKCLHEIILPLSISIFFLAFSSIALPANATGIYDLPNISAGEPTWVIDQADAISIANEGHLNNILQKLAKQTGNEVRLVAIRRLDFEETIDTFSDKLFAKWFPTTESQANQTILVIDTLTNNVGIRTGEGVKNLITDDIAKSTIDETVGVSLRDGSKYNQAFLDASARLVAVLSGNPDPGPPQVRDTVNTEGTFATAEETDDRSATIWVVVLLILATIIPMATYFFYVGFNN